MTQNAAKTKIESPSFGSKSRAMGVEGWGAADMREVSLDPQTPSSPAVRRPLRIHLLTIFLVILFIICGSVIAFSTVLNRDAALVVAQEHMHTALGGIVERTRRLFREIQTFVRTASSMPGMSMHPGEHGHPLVPMLKEAISHMPEVDGVYIGYADGSFVHLVLLRDSVKWREKVSAPPEAVLAIRTIVPDANGQRLSRWTFWNKDDQEISSTPPIVATYDPRERPWYRAALRTDDVAWTQPYVFSTTKQVGVTISRMVSDGGGVIGADVTLDELSQFLATQKISPSSEAMVFNGQGNLIVHPEINSFTFKTVDTPMGPRQVLPIEDSPNKRLVATFEEIKRRNWEPGNGFLFSVDGETYMASLQKLPSDVGEGAYLSMTAPVRELAARVDEINRDSLYISLGLMLLSVPLVVLASRRIAGSLVVLAGEAARLRDLDMTEPVTVTTRVQEVQALADALASAKVALSTFGQYVPKALVRKIVQNGETPTLGGDRRFISVLFTDIEGFTTISESLEPEDLMERLSDYFRGMTQIVHGHNGTINKFIGDAVMALWNVPDVQANHVVEACRCALAARQYLEAYNQSLQSMGLPPFRTRFGIHCGEAVVGHIGNADRMEYTALGDTVNVASRLEGLNKNYGTTILISDDVVKQVGDQFEVRFVAYVAPKGRKSELPIYELVSEKTSASE